MRAICKILKPFRESETDVGRETVNTEHGSESRRLLWGARLETQSMLCVVGKITLPRLHISYACTDPNNLQQYVCVVRLASLQLVEPCPGCNFPCSATVGKY
uniref:Uncharacterized protein n=1 Tax=Mucochytrium quahogii TaxID=96639 RepID=A0A7S2W312_9STRA|mmetsp:Transcript_23946/g.38260  ORF Transcript_23946/g.38260 Transcript_23946/m.38260 type:complete len:102 (+) Transcript_23946:441-746(+)